MAKIVGSEEGITKLLVALLESDDATARTDALATIVAIAAHPENYERVISEVYLNAADPIVSSNWTHNLKGRIAESVCCH